ncbi:MAG: tetratricopeptide repeat protein [Haliea sp.]
MAEQFRRIYKQAVRLHQEGHLQQAQTLYRQVLAAHPRHFDSLHLLGVIALQTGNPELGIELIREAIRLDSKVAAAHFNLGTALLQSRQAEQALASFDRALSLQPDHVSALNNRANVLLELNRPAAALASYDRALALKPGSAEGWYNRGNALLDMGRAEEALASFQRALALNPSYAEAWHNAGRAQSDLNQLEEVAICYTKALALRPDYEFLLGKVLHARMQLCDWEGFPDNLALLQTQLRAGRRVTTPFPLIGLLESPQLQKQAAEIYAAARLPPNAALGPLPERQPGHRVKVGYYSADFYGHATAYLGAQLFEAHDRERFELFAFSFGPDRQDAMSQRVAAAFDHFLEVGSKTDLEVARLSRELGIDIAVDLKGYTRSSRPGMFAARCAPLQVSYLGYPGTMGTSCIDYIVADRVVIPECSQAHFSEQVVYLPYSYQANDSRREIAPREFSRQELGLPGSGFVFCCFNANYKIMPATFTSWMNILRAVPGSVLWLLEGSEGAVRNLRQQAEARGVDSGRLVFAPRLETQQHLARHRAADLFLDTLPCNAHTTASDALWAGLPLLTCVGATFAGRVAASLLQTLELPELITTSAEEYEARAIALATNPSELAQLRSRLAHSSLSSPLFDGRQLAQQLEKAFSIMHERHLAGATPEAFAIA